MSKRILISNRVCNSKRIDFDIFQKYFNEIKPEKLASHIFEKRIREPLIEYWDDELVATETFTDPISGSDFDRYKRFWFAFYRKEIPEEERGDKNILCIVYANMNFETIRFYNQIIYFTDAEKTYLGKTTHCNRNTIGVYVDRIFPIIDYDQAAGGGSHDSYDIVYSDPVKNPLVTSYDEIIPDYIYQDENDRIYVRDSIRSDSYKLIYEFFKTIITRALQYTNPNSKNKD